MKLFVYGTLRDKGSAPTHFINGYDMYDYYGRFPYIQPTVGDRCFHSRVYGNLVEVTASKLKLFDKYEGIKTGLFTRQEVPVFAIDNVITPVTAYVYVAGNIAPPVIDSGDWLRR